MAKNLHATAARTLNDNILALFGPKKTAGHNGIEIEVEGLNLPAFVGDGKIWNAIADGSLRGESKEYVFAKPLKEEAVAAALDQLDKAFKDNKSQINNSYRTSVHVHVNVQDLTMRQLYNYICLYIIFEDILIDMCGRERDGNLFCLRVTDAEGLIGSLKEYLVRGSFMSFKGIGLRYASFNINAVGKYGSLEFRAYRGTTDKDDILTWTKLLNRLHDASRMFDDPQAIMAEFSKLGYEAFTRKVFGNNPVANFILAAKGAEERLVFGVRYAQEVAYCIKTWNAPVPNEAQMLYAGLNQAPKGWVDEFNRGQANHIDAWGLVQQRIVPMNDDQQEEEI